MVRTVTIKTQARRLAFFSAIINILNRKGSQKEIISLQLIKFISENENDLSFPYNTGIIRSSQSPGISNSLNIYLDAGLQLEIFDNFSSLILPSKLGLVLKSLSKKQELYPLSKTEILFYKYVILKNDADTFLTICASVEANPSQKLNSHLRTFQTNYLDRLESRMKISSGLTRNKISESRRRVKSWQSPIRYSEDILPPRLNWMTDLGMLDQDYLESEVYTLSNYGKQFISSLVNKDGNLELTHKWLRESFFSSIDADENSTDWNEIHNESKNELMSDLLLECTLQFRTMNIPRLPIEGTFLYLCITLFVEHKIIANFQNLEEFIGSSRKLKNKTYAMRKSAREYESYIVIK